MLRMYLCLLVILCYLPDTKSSCKFPAYMFSGAGTDGSKLWTSETRYIENTGNWTSQKEITVYEDEISVKRKFHGHCFEGGRNKPCYKKELLYKRLCYHDEGQGKFRVQHQDVGKRSMFTCMKFVQRNKNVVQVWAAPPNEKNEHSLCDNDMLQREDWPWIDPKEPEWSPCPIAGGFDFRTYVGIRRQMMCESQWRPSRMESECIMGEGLRFHFPHISCSPIQFEHYINIQCWVHCQESGYTFIIFGERAKPPQYVLRLQDGKNRNSSNASERRHVTGYLYFAVVTPIGSSRRVIGKVSHVLLKMKRSEPGLCYDHSEKCAQFAREGKCTNSAIHEYANFCIKSCGLCHLMPSNRAECRFPTEFRGKWAWFQADRTEDVRITVGQIVFSTLGRFICKRIGPEWSTKLYKLLSGFKNGCRPRYTCMHMAQDEDSDKVLRFQLAKSTETDESFNMCNFEDDPPPVGNKVRSHDTKILLSAEVIRYNHCGLGGAIQVDMNEAWAGVHRRCVGILSDWSSLTCRLHSTISFAPTRCADGTNGQPKDFKCVAYVDMDGGSSRLITQDHTGTYSCMIIRTHPESMSLKPWKGAYQLKKAQCGMETDFDASVVREAPLHLKIPQAKPERQCIGSVGQDTWNKVHNYESHREATYRPVLDMSPKPLWTQPGNGVKSALTAGVFHRHATLGFICSVFIILRLL